MDSVCFMSMRVLVCQVNFMAEVTCLFLLFELCQWFFFLGCLLRSASHQFVRFLFVALRKSIIIFAPQLSPFSPSARHGNVSFRRCNGFYCFYVFWLDVSLRRAQCMWTNKKPIIDRTNSSENGPTMTRSSEVEEERAKGAFKTKFIIIFPLFNVCVGWRAAKMTDKMNNEMLSFEYLSNFLRYTKP